MWLLNTENFETETDLDSAAKRFLESNHIFADTLVQNSKSAE